MVTVTVTVPGAAPVSGWQPLPPPRGRLSGQLETGVRTLGQEWSRDYPRHSPGLPSTLPNADSPGLTSTLPDAKMLSTCANGQKAPRSFAKLIELSCMLSIRGFLRRVLEADRHLIVLPHLLAYKCFRCCEGRPGWGCYGWEAGGDKSVCLSWGQRIFTPK